MKLYISVSFLLLIFYSFGQQKSYINYKKECNNAYNESLKNGNYKQALKTLKQVEKQYDFLCSEEYALKAYCYKKLGKSKACAKSVRATWSHVAFDWDYLREIPELSPMFLMEGFTEKEKKIVQQGYDNFAKLPKSKYADSVLNIIDSLLVGDQNARKMVIVNDSISNENAIRAVDSSNMIVFEQIIKQFGFPGEKFAPGGKSSEVFILLLHFSDYSVFFDRMNEILLQEVKKGNMSPSYYLFWLDRNYFSRVGKSKYGIYVPKDVEIENESEIFNLRLEFGLVNCYPKISKALQFN